MSAKKTPAMSNALAAEIIALAAKAILQNDTPNKSSQGKPAQHKQASRSGSHVPNPNGPPSSSKASNKTQQQSNNTKKQNGKDVYQFVVPEGADYEIKIIKQSSKSTETKVSEPKSTQNNQNRGVNKQPNQQNANQKRSDGNQNQQGNKNQQNDDQNKSKGNQNKPKGNQSKPQDNQHKPNANQNKPIGNQNKPNSNQNKSNSNQNKTNSNQNKPSGNQNAPGKVQGHQNQKHGNLTSGKNNPGQNSSKPRDNGQSSGQNTWMYLGRLKVGTTYFEIKNYLLQKFPGYDFTVETLPLYKDAKLPCFKVNVDNGILDDFKNLENWPQGVKITKFIEHFKVKA